MLTREEYEKRYTENFRVTGYGIEGTTNHFPCPFCAAPEWYVVRVVDFGPPLELRGDWRSEDLTCEECGRTAVHVGSRDGGNVEIGLRLVSGDDPPEYVPVPREGE